MYTNTDTGCFEMTDQSLEQIALLEAKGQQTIAPALEHLVFSNSKGVDEYIFLWPAGSCTLGIIDAFAMEYDVVEGLGGTSSVDSIPFAMVSAEHGRKVITVTHKKVGNTFYLNYWQKSPGSRVVTRPAEFLDNDSK